MIASAFICFMFPRVDRHVFHIQSAENVQPSLAAVGRDFHAPAFFDPAAGKANGMCRMHAVHEEEFLIVCREFLNFSYHTIHVFGASPSALAGTPTGCDTWSRVVSATSSDRVRCTRRRTFPSHSPRCRVCACRVFRPDAPLVFWPVRP